MITAPPGKVTAQHLKRNAYLYVRQSSVQQVMNHQEGARRQYALRERARALGWSEQQVIVIDTDQGQSGSGSADRIGFQNLVAEVGMGHAGLVMGLEVSRLARNSGDWHRLLEICALTDTLILDEDGIYNPAHFNDRLLLGLKGTMSEAELHVIRSRLQGGILSKARRGELELPLPIGFVYKQQSEVVLDPDLQIREAVRTLFSTFRRVGSILGAAKEFRRIGLLFPRRPPIKGPRDQRPVIWKDLDFNTAHRILHNPRYAGIYSYGKTRQYRHPDGRIICQKVDPEDWAVWIPEAHEGYISEEAYRENLRRIAENANAIGADHRSSVREGPALLQGIVICGRCGRKMTMHYHKKNDGTLVGAYICHRKETSGCQYVHAPTVDDPLVDLLVEMMTPMSLEVSLSVQQEIEQRLGEAEGLRRKQVQRAHYEADLAKQRFLQVDPGNRLVALSLETEWNEKLVLLQAEQAEYERRLAEDRRLLDEKQKTKIMSLASDFSRLWNDPGTPARERKRIVRLLVQDVTLDKDDRTITARIRFKGGATRTLNSQAPQPASALFKTSASLVQKIDELLDHHFEGEVAKLLNEQGISPPRASSFDTKTVCRIRRVYKLKSRYDRLREQGYLSGRELSAKLHVATETLMLWRDHGLLRAVKHNATSWLYQDPADDRPPTEARDRLKKAFLRIESQTDNNEVQYEA